MAIAITTNLAELVSVSLQNPNVSPWFPCLTRELAAMGWRAVGRACELTNDNYGTARLLACNPSDPLNFAACLSTRPDTETLETVIPIEVLPSNVVAQYKKTGVNFHTIEAITGTGVLSCLKGAIDVLRLVPSLLTTVVTVVRSLHVLQPESDEYDFSFSEPRLPFSIFVSVPIENTPTNTLRVAEAIVHEAMHLQLTLIEAVVPLLTAASGEYFSPWRGEYRNAKGILHALYVFRVIDMFWEVLLHSPFCRTEVSKYGCERRAEIHKQISEIGSFKECDELTKTGVKFVHRLITGQ